MRPPVSSSSEAIIRAQMAGSMIPTRTARSSFIVFVAGPMTAAFTMLSHVGACGP